MAEARGSTLRATLDFVAADLGTDVLAEVLKRLPAETRARVDAPGALERIPFRALLDVWHATDAVVGAEDPQWLERAGAHSIDLVGAQLYPGIVRRQSPAEFLNQPIKLYRLFYHTGDMQLVQQDPGHAVLRLVDFDEPDALFCSRQTGGLRRLLELAGGAQARAEHVRCTLEGDAFCEWELRWA